MWGLNGIGSSMLFCAKRATVALLQTHLPATKKDPGESFTCCSAEVSVHQKSNVPLAATLQPMAPNPGGYPEVGARCPVKICIGLASEYSF